MKRPVYYLGLVPATCELCGKPITTTFVDGATTAGQWAIMCDDCWSNGYKKPGICGLGGALGVGRGQRYTIQSDGRWLKTEG